MQGFELSARKIILSGEFKRAQCPYLEVAAAAGLAEAGYRAAGQTAERNRPDGRG